MWSHFGVMRISVMAEDRIVWRAWSTAIFKSSEQEGTQSIAATQPVRRARQRSQPCRLEGRRAVSFDVPSWFLGNSSWFFLPHARPTDPHRLARSKLKRPNVEVLKHCRADSVSMEPGSQQGRPREACGRNMFFFGYFSCLPLVLPGRS